MIPEEDLAPSTEAAGKDGDAGKGGKGGKPVKKAPKVKAVGLSDNVEALTTAFNTFYNSERGKRARTSSAIVTLLLMFFYSASFFSYRWVKSAV